MLRLTFGDEQLSTLSELLWIPVVHIQSLQVTLRDSCQFCNNVTETCCCGDVRTCLSTLIIIVDYGRTLVMAQNDGTQNSISTLESRVKESSLCIIQCSSLSMHVKIKIQSKKNPKKKKRKGKGKKKGNTFYQILQQISTVASHCRVLSLIRAKLSSIISEPNST